MDQFTETVNFLVYTLISIIKVIPELLSWPVIVLIIAFVYKQPISQLIQNIVDIGIMAKNTKFTRKNELDLEFTKFPSEHNKMESELYNKMAQVHNCKGNMEEAISHYQKSIYLDPENVSAYIGLGNTYYKMGNNEEAIKTLVKAVEIKPYWADARFNLGTAYSLAGFNENAIIEFLQALEINSNYSAAMYGLGISYLALNQVDKARNQFTQLKKLDPLLAEKLSEAIDNQSNKNKDDKLE